MLYISDSAVNCLRIEIIHDTSSLGPKALLPKWVPLQDVVGVAPKKGYPDETDLGKSGYTKFSLFLYP